MAQLRELKEWLEENRVSNAVDLANACVIQGEVDRALWRPMFQLAVVARKTGMTLSHAFWSVWREVVKEGCI